MSNNEIDRELNLQRCVDGELNEVLQSKLIKELDDAPHQDGWRELALQFMEQQVLRDVFGNRQRMPEFQSSSKNLDSEIRGASPSMPSRSFSTIISTAAAAVLGLLLGANFNREAIQQNQAQVVSRQVIDQNVEESPPREAPTFDIYEIPSDEMFYQEIVMPADLRQQIENAGYVIERKSHRLRVPTENGREIIVPSETIRIRNTHR